MARVTETKYWDKDGKEHVGYITDAGVTLTNPNDPNSTVAAGSIVQSVGGDYWIKGENGSTKYTGPVPGSSSKPTVSSGNTTSSASSGIVSTGSGTSSPVSSGTPAKGTTQNGRYYTTIKDALGNTYNGYIDTATGKSYHSNGQRLNVGDIVEGAGGVQWLMTQNGGVRYDPNDPEQRLVLSEVVNQELAKQRTEQQIADIEAQLPALNQQYDRLARGNWVNYRLGERDLDQQLAAAGYTGGLAESSKVGLYGDYMTNYAEGETARAQAIDEINRQIANAKADGNAAGIEITLQYASLVADALAQKQTAQAQEAARELEMAILGTQYGVFGPLGELIDGLDVEGLTAAWKAQNTPQYTSSRSSGGYTKNAGTGGSSTAQEADLFEEMRNSGRPYAYLQQNYKKFGVAYSGLEGVWQEYQEWVENKNLDIDKINRWLDAAERNINSAKGQAELTYRGITWEQALGEAIVAAYQSGALTRAEATHIANQLGFDYSF